MRTVEENRSLAEENARLRSDLADARRLLQSPGGNATNGAAHRAVCPREESEKLGQGRRDWKEEALLREKMEKAHRLDEARFHAFFQLSRMTGASVRQIVHFLLEELARITNSRAAVMAFLDSDEKVSSIYSWPEESMAVQPHPEGLLMVPVAHAGLWAQAVRERRAVIVNEYSAPHPFKKGVPEGHIPVVRFLSLPVLDGDRVVAFVLLGNKQENYDENDSRRVAPLLEGMWKLFERNRIAQALYERAELLDLTANSVFVRDLDHRIVLWNLGAEARYGWSKQEAVGRVYHQLLRTRFSEPHEAIAAELYREGRWEGELVHTSREGEQVIVSSRWALLRDADGGARSILQIDMDITDRVLMERELEEKNERLREVNAALTVLLRHRNEDRKNFEDIFLNNIENLVQPYVQRLKNSGLNGAQAELVEVLDAHLREIASAFRQAVCLPLQGADPHGDAHRGAGERGEDQQGNRGHSLYFGKDHIVSSKQHSNQTGASQGGGQACAATC